MGLKDVGLRLTEEDMGMGSGRLGPTGVVLEGTTKLFCLAWVLESREGRPKSPESETRS